MTDVPGLVVVDKAAGMTSHDVVARVRRLAGTRKVGHAGTLDPMATGVLVLGINRATRLLGHLMLTEKAYDATIRLGATTVTDDAKGEVVTTQDASAVTDEAVRTGLAALTGPLSQVPSSVSAVKVDGVRSYARVRAGEQVACHEHVRVRVAVQVRGLRVVPGRVRVELVLQVEHVAQQVILDGELGQPDRAREERAVHLRVGREVLDGRVEFGETLLHAGVEAVELRAEDVSLPCHAVVLDASFELLEDGLDVAVAEERGCR